ncbi:MAG: AI-2E family transporter [Deltaproteobacteria bacterium]|nr:AI-2E family transporter [Deltaproteobacteria bacterium]
MSPLPPPSSPAPPPEPRRSSFTASLGLARGQVVVYFFFAAFLFLLWQLYAVFSGFLVPIVWAAILAMLFFPLFRIVLGWCGGRETVAALALTLSITGGVLLPTISLSSVITHEAIGFYQRASQYVGSGTLAADVDRLRQSRLGRWIDRLEGYEIDWNAVARSSVDTVGTLIVAQVTSVAKNVAVFLFDFTIMVFTLFFLFRDGERMYRALRNMIPMDPAHKDAIFSVLYQTLSAVTQGMVATALAQGVLTWVALWALGLPYTAFLGVAAGILSLVPFVGAAGVWIPCTIYLAATGDYFRALILLVYGSVVISMVDNVLRPLLIGGQTRLPTLFLFFGILGGVQVYGVLGLFLGPVLLAIAIAFIRIYQEQFATVEHERRVEA